MARKRSHHDQAARYAGTRLNEAEFLAWLLPRVVAQYDLHRSIDARLEPQPGQPERICDTVASWVHRAGTKRPLATVIEFLTTPSARFLRKLMEYTQGVERDEVYQKGAPLIRFRVAGIVLLLTGTMADRVGEDYTEEDLGAWHYRPKVLALSQESATDTLAAIAAGTLGRVILPWIPLMAGGATLAVRKQWRVLAKQEPSRRLRDDYANLALIFAEAAKCRPEWDRVFRGWNVKKSKVVMEWVNEGRQQGLERGRKQGLKLGKKQAKLEMFETVLRHRFGADALTQLQTRLEAADLDTINHWFDLLLDAVDWATLEPTLQLDAPTTNLPPQ